MNKYPKYKPSGISWIGEIPDGWKEFRFSSICKEKTIRNKENEELLSVFLDRGVIRFSDVEKKRTNVTSTDLSKYQLVEVGDFVLNNQQAWRGSVGVSSLRGIVSPAYIILSVSKQLDTDFANYLFRSSPIVALYYCCSKSVGSIQRNLDWQELKSKSIFIPSLPEQKQIVKYLNQKVTLIDNYIVKKRKQIELLNEQKQALVAHIVTRGLNPNAKFKDSGISWIGEIPDEWEVKKIRSLFKESKESSKDGKGTLLSLSQYTGVKPKSECEKTGMFEAESTVGYNIVHKGQFVMNIMLAWNGSYAVSELDGIISPSYCIFDFIPKCEKKYFDYLLRIKAYSGAFKTKSSGLIDSRLRLYPVKFYTFPIPIPPLPEQKQIVEYLDKKTKKINSLIENINRQIELLQEYKQRLIADVVTGKVNVQNVKID